MERSTTMSLAKMVKSIKAGDTLGLPVTSYLRRTDEVRAETVEGAKLMASMIGSTDHDRSGVFHPSSSGRCLREQMFDYEATPRDQQHSATLKAIFHDGHFRHLRWQLMLLNMGRLTRVEVPVSNEQLKAAGSMDGVNDDEGWLFELKGTSRIKTVQDGPTDAHRRQVHAYFLLSGLRKAIIVYEDKSNQEFVEHEIEADQGLLDDVEQEFIALAEHVNEGTMPAILPMCQQQKGNQYRDCPYQKHCLGADSRPDGDAGTRGM